MSRAEFIFYIFGNLLFTATVYFIMWGESPAEWGIFARGVVSVIWALLNLLLTVCVIEVRQESRMERRHKYLKDKIDKLHR